MTCRYLKAKGDGLQPWYWCDFLGKQVRTAEHGCGDDGCQKLRDAEARAAARAAAAAKPKSTVRKTSTRTTKKRS